MTLKSLLQKSGLDWVRINAKFLQANFTFTISNQDAAWELYVVMLIRIVTQTLPPKSGDEKAALDSVYTPFPTTREILCRHGREAINISKVAVPILNQVVRPFTAKCTRV